MKFSTVKSHAKKEQASLRSPSSSRTTNVKLVMMTVLIIIVFSVYSGISTFVYSLPIMTPAYAQAIYGLKTIKSRDLVIDLGNGLTTKAQLTIPLLGKGPFPGVLLIHGSGIADKDYYVNSNIAPFLQISQYLSERGFAVLRYDKRGVGPNFTVSDANVWGNLTVSDLKSDAEKALAVLMNQPEVDPNKITMIGHSEGTAIVPRIAIDNPSKVKNIVLMGAAANNTRDLVYFREVTVPLLYAQKVLDHNHNGLISVSEAIKDPVFNFLTRNFTLLLLNTGTTAATNGSKQQQQSNPPQQQQSNTNKDVYMSINNEPKQKLIAQAKALSTIIPGKKCTDTGGCPTWLNSQYALQPNVNIVDNVPPSTSILILQGGNDTATPLQQAFLLQQALIDKRHPDHTLITYPNLGHGFHLNTEWMPIPGGIQPYVLADLYSWLAAHSGFTSTATAITSSNGTMASSPPSSSSSLSSNSPTTNTTQSRITLLNNKGTSLYNLGRFNESIAYFDKALAMDANNIAALDNKGLALLSVSIKNYTQAIMYFDKALAIDPKNVAALFHKGNALAGLGNYTQAITYYDRVLSIDPKNVAALDNRGVAFYHLGNYSQAITYYDNALAIDPKNAVALTDKGNALSALGNYTVAIPYFDKALSLDPKNVLAIIGKGYALDHSGDHTQAVTYYNKAISIDPRYIADLTHKGNFLTGLGNYKLAIMYFDKALAINPKNVDAATGKRQAQAALSQPK